MTSDFSPDINYASPSELHINMNDGGDMKGRNEDISDLTGKFVFFYFI